MIYFELFMAFVKVGLFSFGGGYAAMPLIRDEIVMNHMWLTMTEFNDLITISQMTPGPIAVNSATFVGLRVGGLLGALLSTIGCILPSCIIVVVLAYLYLKYRKLSSVQNVLYMLRPSVIAMILVSGILIIVQLLFPGNNYSLMKIDLLVLGLFIFASILIKHTKINPIFIMMIIGLINVLIHI